MVIRLSAWYIASRNRGAVVTVPGAGSTRSATLDQATVLAGHGYGVLLMDPRGQGRRPAADRAGYLPRGVDGAIQRFMDRLTYGTAALLRPAPEPGTLHGAIARARSTAFLLIAGGKAADEPVAVAYLRSAAPERVRTWVVPGATHTHGLVTAPAEWTARVTAFLDRALDIPAGNRG